MRNQVACMLFRKALESRQKLWEKLEGAETGSRKDSFWYIKPSEVWCGLIWLYTGIYHSAERNFQFFVALVSYHILSIQSLFSDLDSIETKIRATSSMQFSKHDKLCKNKKTQFSILPNYRNLKVDGLKKHQGNHPLQVKRDSVFQNVPHYRTMVFHSFFFSLNSYIRKLLPLANGIKLAKIPWKALIWRQLNQTEKNYIGSIKLSFVNFDCFPWSCLFFLHCPFDYTVDKTLFQLSDEFHRLYPWNFIHFSSRSNWLPLIL